MVLVRLSLGKVAGLSPNTLSTREIFCDCVIPFSMYVAAHDFSHCRTGSIPVFENVQSSENPDYVDYWPVVVRVTLFGRSCAHAQTRAARAFPLRVPAPLSHTTVSLQRNKFSLIFRFCEISNLR